MKKTIPIVFSTDKNYVSPACVCISSLLLNAKKEDFFDIYIIIDKGVDELSRNKLKLLEKHFVCCAITLVDFSYNIDKAYQVGVYTLANYYRLLIPELITKYDKIFYSDVDIIFRSSISHLYEIDLTEYYLAAAKCLGYPDYVRSINCDPQSYFCSGFILINSKKIREDKLIPKFLELTSRKFQFVDQDILNIVCEGKVFFFSSLLYGYDQWIHLLIMRGEKDNRLSYSEEELQEANSFGLVHFGGSEKPWICPIWRNEIWWEYYRRHPFFDKQHYFEKQLAFWNGDYLSLKRRIRLLIRYFFGKTGLLTRCFQV